MLAGSPQYQRRCPEQQALYQALETGLAQFYRCAEESERTVPLFVQKELDGYLRCGRLEYGFARVHCGGCGFDRLVAFSCKGRGFCPSCGARRMADTAAHLVDAVLPEVPIRQWVCSLPPPLRYLLAYDAKLVSFVVQKFIRAIFRWYKNQAHAQLGLNKNQAHCGAITVVQRFGSALNLNVHLHVLVPDGVFVSENNAVNFRSLCGPTEEECSQVGWQTCLKTLKFLRKRGQWSDDVQDLPDTLQFDEPLLADVYAASIQGTLALGPNRGKRVLRFGIDPGDPKDKNTDRVIYGFDVHAGVRTSAEDKNGRERLCRYLFRPAISNERLQKLGDGRVSLRLKKAWSDGTTHVIFTPLSLVEKLAALIPPPRIHQTRFHGVFAPHSKLRPLVVPEKSAQNPPDTCDAHGRRKNMEWAKLMQRVFDIDVLECPKCSSRMQRVAFITDGKTIRAILNSIGYFAADSPNDTQTLSKVS